MDVDITVEGRQHHVRLEEEDNGWFAVVDGERFPIHVHRQDDHAAVAVGGAVHSVRLSSANEVEVDGRALGFHLDSLQGVAGAPADGQGALGPIRPPMTGTLAEIPVKAGDTVAAGDVLFVLEAMKMRNEVHAPGDGVVTAVHVAAGSAVEPDTVILELAPIE